MDFNKYLGTDPAATDVADQLNNNVPAGADAPPIDTPPADPSPAATEPQSQTPNTDQTTAPAEIAPPVVDYNKYLDEMSGGVIKDADGFKAVLPKISEYDQLKAKHDKIAAEMAQSSFADDEVRILNELKKSGASREQVRNFLKINEYGNLSEMSDKDALIAAMVSNGTKPSTAELKVNRDYKLTDDDLDPAERELLDDDMRVAANASRTELAKLKADLSKVNNIPAEEIELQQTAQLMAHQAKVVPYVKEVMASVPNLGSFSLKSGEDTVTYEVPIDDNLRGQLGQYVQNYFMDGLTEVTPETTRMAMQYARAEYFREHAQEVLQAAFEKGVSTTTEKLTAKYENRSGLKNPGDNPTIQGVSDAAATAKYMADKVNRRGVTA